MIEHWSRAERWRKSTRSQGQANCVEVRCRDHDVLVRDSKDRLGPVLSVRHAAWEAFVNEITCDVRTTE
ncbi:hypothetical protein Athai_05050 [Actinocatenispora thailandica]|uniref:DUF397 domain-containing protein n=1 Tax=Actinocatenispora thailandica TaxID=227318 RepID=A0A7R7DKC1_9ACTN|nr:DUF397 domain-containing protein [Actinocatenispora thailandica]BCJ33002.1 hypothetical protein Athai_05050 [Actinocatenispora thailandica]